MKRWTFWTVLIALLLGPPVFTQGVGIPQLITVIDSGTACSVTGTCASFTMSAINVVAFDVSGTWTGTLTPEGSVNGAPFRTILTTNPADGSSTSAITANGTYTVPNSGFTQVRLRATATITGTAFVGAAQGYLSARVTSPSFTNISFTGQATGPTGCTTPPYSFTGRTTTGVCSSAANTVDLATASTARLSVSTTSVTTTLPLIFSANATINPSSGAGNLNVGTLDGSSLVLFTNNTNAFAINGTQNLVDQGQHTMSAGAGFIAGIASTTGAQYRSTQSLPPVCYVNCGTAPTVAGTDSDMIVTMGASGVPASLWQVGFRGAWASKPSCTGTMALGTMAIGKFPMVIATTTGGLTVTTNGTSPATSDVYNIHCAGTQ